MTSNDLDGVNIDTERAQRLGQQQEGGRLL